MYEVNKENVVNAAVATLTDIWSQINWEGINGKRAMGIWDEFVSKVKASAMTTDNYERFVEKLSRKMEVRSLKYSDISKISDETTEFKKAILKLFREETQLIVLKLRLNNQIRKEELEKKKEREDKEQKLENKLDNTQVTFLTKGVKAHEN